jgi:16S rRNA (uracil1498-N3)-methyltransferase
MFLYISNLEEERVAGEESAHFFSLRIKEGQCLWVTDLKGKKAKIKITSISKKLREVTYHILEKIETSQEKRPKKIIFQALLDKQYQEKLVELLPLIKINTLFFFPSKNSQPHKVQLDRLERILIRSCEQSESVFKPKIEILNEREVFDKIQEFKPTVMEVVNKDIGTREIEKGNNDHIVVGPEGGWDSSELQKFRELNLPFINLGETVFPS